LVIHDDPLFVKNNEKIIYSKDLKKNIIKFLDSFYSIDINSNNFFASEWFLFNASSPILSNEERSGINISLAELTLSLKYSSKLILGR